MKLTKNVKGCLANRVGSVSGRPPACGAIPAPPLLVDSLLNAQPSSPRPLAPPRPPQGQPSQRVEALWWGRGGAAE